MLLDVEALREALIDYAGSAAAVGFPLALGDVAALEKATPEELVHEAEHLGFDLTRFAL